MDGALLRNDKIESICFRNMEWQTKTNWKNKDSRAAQEKDKWSQEPKKLCSEVVQSPENSRDLASASDE